MKCSFCGRSQLNVDVLVTPVCGDAAICDGCLALADGLVASFRARRAEAADEAALQRARSALLASEGLVLSEVPA